jgi:hypothetical protein
MEDAVADALNRLASALTRYNARAHLMDLPQDVDIVNVEPVAHRIKRPHRYVRQAPFPSQARPET